MTMPSRMSGAFGIDRRRTARKTGRVLLLVALALSLLVPGVAPVLATTRPLTTLAAPRAQRADAGYYFGAEIRSDGTLWTWGYNYYGQLGDGTFITKTSPVQVGHDRDWASVSAGDSHVLAIKTDGTLWAWGWNDYYTLGLGETDAHYSPTQVGTDTDWVSVAAGEMHSLGLKSDGTLWAWGDNAEGQLGQGDNLDEMVPAQVGSDADWAGIAAGAYSSAAIKVDGTLWMWGANGNGQLGLGDTAPRTSPDMVTGDDWTSVSLGYAHSVGLQSDGTLWTWGYNGYGQLGLDDTGARSNPVQVTQPDSQWRSVSTGAYYTMAVREDGSLWAAGSNLQGQLGLGDTDSRDVLTQVGSDTDWVLASGGYSHTLGVKSDGSAWTSGDNSLYQLGDGTEADRSSFGQVGVQADWVALAAGDFNSLAVRGDGSLWGWGNNAGGELGLGDANPRQSPVLIDGDHDWRAVSEGWYFTLALMTDGSLWSCGYNHYGDLGLGDTTPRYTFTHVPSDVAWSNVSAGEMFAVGVKEDGTLWSWGFNATGQLGLGNTDEQHSPTQVGTDSDWVVAEAGPNQAFAIKSDGTLWAWGFNSQGQLGVGDTDDRWQPTQVGTASDWRSVALGYGHTIATTTDGALYAWGYNGYGQLGLDSTTEYHYPVRVGTESDWLDVDAGYYSSMALRGDGTLWACGDNDRGYLGDGTNTRRDTFTQTQTEPGVAAFAFGGYHAVAAGSDGGLYTWGSHEFSRLGTPIDADVWSPRFIIGGRSTAVGGVFTATAGGTGHSLSIKGDGTLWAWGENSVGQLGLWYGGGSTPFPVRVGTENDWVAVAAAGDSSYAIKSGGTLWAWGRNSVGQLGLGDTSPRLAPTQVNGDTDWISVATRLGHVLAIKSDGTLWAWGGNGSGQLGDDSTNPSYVPIQVGTDTDWTSAAAGYAFSAAIKSDGTLWTWGENASGQLGSNSTEDTWTPAAVGAETDWVSVTAGLSHSLGLKSDGTLWGWGENAVGQTGTGMGPDVLAPLQIGADDSWAQVMAGIDHSHAVKADGTMWGWGVNSFGRIGDSSTSTRYTPVQVGAGTSWTAASPGVYHSLALAADGSLWVWGHNDTYQLGNGTSSDVYVPVNSFAPGDVVTPAVLAVLSDTHPFAGYLGGADFSARVYGVDGESRVTGMSWAIDQVPDTVTDTTVDSYGALAQVDAMDLDPGTWYLHARAQDLGYNWSETVHFEFNVNSPPDAVDDSDSTTEDTPLTVPAPGVLANDSDPDGDTVTVTGMSDGIHGTVAGDSDGSFIYTPEADWNGSDAFTYAVSDGRGGTDEATVTVEVTSVNDAPEAVADSYTTAEDTVLTKAAPGVLANDDDVDGDAITAVKVSGPAHGTLTLSATGSFTYTPSADYNGTDSFTYRANDGTTNSGTVTVTLKVTPVDDEEPLPPVIPVAGNDRFETAVEASKEAYPDGLDSAGERTVVIATGRNWPDALGGSSLAGALDGPILLVDTDSVPGEVTAEIKRLDADKAIILGGTAAVGAPVETALKSQLGQADVTRIAGTNRYDTANRVAKRVISEAGAGYDGTAFVATGDKFPDALGAAPIAAANAWPLYLASPSSGLSAATKSAMAGVEKVVVLGGTAVVSAEVESYLKSKYGAGDVTRLAGSDRYETAVKVATYGVQNAGLGWNRVAIATGLNFPDALAGGVLQGKVGSVMLLTKPEALNGYTKAALTAHRDEITTVTYFGGVGALPQVVRDQVEDALD